MPLPPPFLTADYGVELHELTPADWQLEQDLSRDPDVVRWTLYPPDLTPEEAVDRLTRSAKLAEDGLIRRYAVRLEGQVLGTAGISVRSDPPEVFYALLPAGRGKGAATAAARALSGWALDHCASSVELVTISDNTASAAVAERAGFTPGAREVADQRGVPAEMLRWRRSKNQGWKEMSH